MATSHLPGNWTAQDVRGWLLATFKSGQSNDVLLFKDLDLSVQIQRIFDDSSATAQEMLKAGTVLALREWRPRAHGTRVLEDLCNVVALLKITAAISVLDRVARSVLQHRPGSDALSILSTVCGTVGGLGPGTDVELALRAIVDDHRCPPQLAGQLFIGLCRCRPDGYWEFVPRFRELRDRSPETLVNVTLAAGFADAVPTHAILEGLKHLTDQDRAEILWMIEHIPDPGIRTVLTQRVAPPRTVDLEYAKRTGSAQAAPDLANWFQQEIKPFSTAGGTINDALLRGRSADGLGMTVTRHQLQGFVSYAERLTRDLEVLVEDLQYRAAGNEVSLAVDFSEIHSFLIPDPLEDDWLWPGLPKHIVASVEHSALSRVLTGPPHPVLLPPYAVEFQNFLSHQRSGLQEQAAQAFPAALDSLDALHERPETKALLELASTVQRNGRELTADELETAVSFFEAHASDLVQLLRRKDPAAQARALLSTHPFRSIESIVTLSVTGDEPDVCERFARLRRIRHARDQRGQAPDLEQERRDRERDRSAFLDAVAVEYVKRTNEWFVRERFPARLLLVTRSKNLHRLIEQEVENGKWRKVGYSVVRHPRVFAPLAWHAPRSFQETAQELEATRQSVALFRQSAEFRLRGGTWETLRRTRTDAPLIAMVESLQKQIEALVRIGGTVADADIVATADSKPRDREVLRLLAMLRSREEVFHAVAERMSTINSDVDLAYVALGFMVESRQRTEPAATVAPAAERIVLPRLGPLPYALQFASVPFAESVAQLRTRGEVPLDHLWRLVLEAVQQPSDHYEALLFMAYLLATMNRWSLGEKYCDRALLSARQQHRSDRREAMFFRAVCIRQWAQASPRMLEALKQLDEAFSDVERASDPRYLAARGSLKLAWFARAQRDPEKWGMHPAPTLGDCLADLQAAHAVVLASNDVRLQSAVENNICFALCLMYEAEPSRELRVKANESWARLIDTCYKAEADVKRWPVRIIDTVAQGFLLLNDSAHDNALLESLVEALERRHKTELAGDEKELIALNLKRYKDKLGERKAARTSG